MSLSQRRSSNQLMANDYVNGSPLVLGAVNLLFVACIKQLLCRLHWQVEVLHCITLHYARVSMPLVSQVQYGKQSQELKRPATSTIADLKAEVRYADLDVPTNSGGEAWCMTAA